jgi:hypothetical protein
LAYGFAPWVADIDLTERRPPAAQPAGIGHIVEKADMDTEHRAVAELLALKDAPDDVLLDQVEAIGLTTVRSILYDEAKRLRYTDQQAKMDCIALMNRINEMIRPRPA